MRETLRCDNAFLIQIAHGRGNVQFVQAAGDSRIAHPRKPPLEYVAHDRGRFRVRLNPVGIVRAFAVAIRRPIPDKLSPLLLQRQRGTDFSGDVLAVGVVQDVFQVNDVSVAGTFSVQRVEIVLNRNEADAHEGENLIQIVSGFQIIASETGKVFHHNAVNFAALHVLHHTLKFRTFEIRSAPSVVGIQSGKLHVRLGFDIFPDELILRVNRIRAGFSAVAHGQPAVAARLVNPAFRLNRGRNRQERIRFSAFPRHLRTPPFQYGNSRQRERIPEAVETHRPN